MILYFSGTHNSKFVAERLGQHLNEAVKLITEISPDNISFDTDSCKSETLGFVFPIYSWGVPPIMLEFVSRLNEIFVKESFVRYVWMVATCGDESGEAHEMFLNALRSHNITLNASWDVIMPNVYVLLPGFDVDRKDIEVAKLDNAIIQIDSIAHSIAKRIDGYNPVKGRFPHLKTGIIYPFFKRWGISPGKWRWSKECVRCGKCALVCPVKNITMKGGHPSWGKECVSCLACYHICPVHAVEYGSGTKNKGQYFCRRR